MSDVSYAWVAAKSKEVAAWLAWVATAKADAWLFYGRSNKDKENAWKIAYTLERAAWEEFVRESAK